MIGSTPLKNMNNLTHINRLQQLHLHIKAANTGAPRTLAKKLCVSRRNPYFLIDKLKLYGAKIRYSRKRKTFYYEDDDFDMITTLKVEIIHKGVAKKIYGGTTFSKKNPSVLTTYTEQT
jgi:hypothetical protein